MPWLGALLALALFGLVAWATGVLFHHLPPTTAVEPAALSVLLVVAYLGAVCGWLWLRSRSRRKFAARHGTEATDGRLEDDPELLREANYYLAKVRKQRRSDLRWQLTLGAVCVVVLGAHIAYGAIVALTTHRQSVGSEGRNIAAAVIATLIPAALVTWLGRVWIGPIAGFIASRRAPEP
jgi:hypothetical protein